MIPIKLTYSEKSIGHLFNYDYPPYKCNFYAGGLENKPTFTVCIYHTSCPFVNIYYHYYEGQWYRAKSINFQNIDSEYVDMELTEPDPDFVKICNHGLKLIAN